MNGGFALPRVRSRRRKPRGPHWRRQAMWCCVWAVLLLGNLLSLAPFGVIALEWRRLHRFPADPDAKPLSVAERESDARLSLLVMALLLLNFVVVWT